jgi:hypothetical protein
MRKNVVFGGDYEKRGLFWRRDMPIIIAGMFLLALATMDSIIRGPMLAIDKQLTEMKSFAPERVTALELRVAALENAEAQHD